MATSTFFVRSDGRIRGPFDAMQLHRMLQRGQLLWQHELSEDRRHWIKAEDHPMFVGLAPVKGSEPDLVIEPITRQSKGPPPLPVPLARPRQAPAPYQNQPTRNRSRRDPDPIPEAQLIEEVPMADLLDLSDTVSDLPAPSLPETNLFDEIDLESWNEQ